jgi:hypothetical protein
MKTVNSELLRMARTQFNKKAIAPPGGAAPADPAAMSADPAAAMAMDPNMMAAVQAAPMDMAAGGQPAPAPAPAADPAAGGGAAPQQKLKPEQMMQMIDYRMYNMQQQLTAIMNAMGVQLPPESIVLPPGSTSAPSPETALPGGQGAPTAPPPAAPPAAADPSAAQLPSDVYAGDDPAQTGGAVQPLPPAKAANWWQNSPVRNKLAQSKLSETAEAVMAIYKSRRADDN